MRIHIITIAALVALCSAVAAQPGIGIKKEHPLVGAGSTASPMRIDACPDGEGYVHDSGAWSCSPVGDITSVAATAGGGLTGGATSGPAYLGLRTTCSVDQVLAWDGDSWECADRDDAGVSGSGTTNRVAKWTGPGTLGDSSITDDGTVVTVGRADLGVVNDKPILSVSNTTTTGGINHRALLRFLTADSGDVLRTSTIEAEGANLFFTSASTLRFQSPSNFASTLNAAGAITEASDRVISLAGTGLTKSGRTLSIDDTYVQRRVSGSCAAGSSIRTIASDGTVTCDSTGAQVITTVNGGSGTANNIDCGAGTTLCRISYGTVTITGFAAGTDGQVMDVVYVGTSSLTVTHQGATSTTANRMILPGAASWTFANGGGLRLYYDGAISRWRAIGPTDHMPSATIAGAAAIAGAATVGATLDVTGETTLSGSLTANSKTYLNDNVDVQGTLGFSGTDPTIASGDCDVDGEAQSMQISTNDKILAGNTCVIDFNRTFTSQPFCTTGVAGLISAVAASQAYVTATTTQVTLHAVAEIGSGAIINVTCPDRY